MTLDIISTGVARSGAHTLVTSSTGVALGLGVSVIVARGWGVTEKGGYDLAVATAGLLTLALGLGATSGATYHVARRLAAPGSLLRLLFTFAVGQGLAALLVLYLLPSLLGGGTAVLSAATGGPAIIAVLIAVSAAASYGRAVLAGTQRIIAANNADLAAKILNVSLLLVALAACRFAGAIPAAPLAVGIAALATGAGMLLMVRALRPELNARGATALRSVVGYSVPSYVANLVQFLNYRLDLFLVGMLRGIEGVALYALAVSIAQLLWIVSTSAAVVLLPAIAAGDPGEKLAGGARLTAILVRGSLAVTLLGALGLAVVAGPLIPLVYGPAFRGATSALLLLLPGVVAFSIVKVLAAFNAGIGRPRLNLVLGLVGLAVTLPLDLVLIPQLGIEGAAIASSASYSIAAVAAVAIFLRLTPHSLGDLLVVRVRDLRAWRTAFLATRQGEDMA
jgi:O-antigen/teichoic acid export membrane protein